MARRSESIQRLIDDADQSINLLASLDGLADAAPPSTHASGPGRSTLVPPRSTGFSASSASVSSESFDFASSASSVPLLSASLFSASQVGTGATDMDEGDALERATAVVDQSVRSGLLHVCGVFPDYSTEYVDIDPRFASVGELKRALCAKRVPQRDLGFSAADARVMFDGQLVEDDWLVVDCGMGFDGSIYIVKALSGSFLGSSNSSRGFGNRSSRAPVDPKLPIASIASAYSTPAPPSSSFTGSDTGVSSSNHALATTQATSLSVKAAALSRHVRPEEANFAEIASDFYDHLASVQHTDLYCEKLLRGYIDVLQTRLEHLEATAAASARSSSGSSHFQQLQDDMRELRDERNTWRLLYELRQICHARDESADESSDADATMNGDSASNGVLDDELHFDLLDDDAVRLLETRRESYKIQRAVKTWLEHIAREQTVALPATAVARTTGARTLTLLKKGVVASVSGGAVHLDPDAVLRDGDANVVDDDAEDDAEVMKSVWHYVRAGQLSDAVDLCIRLGQSWRAASLSGGTPVGASVNSSGDDASGSLERWGNPHRALWKATCWQFSEHSAAARGMASKASSVLARQYEAIVYAALSGNVAAIAQSPLCETWEDHVWAYLTAMTEHQQDDVMHKLLQVKRQSSQLVVGNSAHYLRQYAALLDKTKYLKRYDGNLDALFDELKGSRVERVRAQANEPHRHIQAKLVTAQVAYIVSHILDVLLFRVDDDSYNWDLRLRETIHADALSPLFVRFAAHFVLFAAFTGEAFDEQAGHMIVKVYIRHLVKHRQLALVPVYASRLPYAGAVEIYVQVLATVDDRLERELVVKRMLEYASMDVLSTVLQIAVDRMSDAYRTRALESVSKMSTMSTIDDFDTQRMRTLAYLCLYPEHRAEALHRANVLAQQFVHERKFRALSTLFAAHVPDDSIAVVERHRSVQTRDAREIDRSIRQVLGWQAYISACSAYDAWRHCVSTSASLRATSASSSALYSEEKEVVTELMYHATRAVTSLLDVLHFEHGWMTQCMDSDADTAAVRAACLPLLVFHLHYVQLESARVLLRLQAYPEAARVDLARPLLEQSLQVADVVADEHYGVYRALSQTECRDLLQGLRESAIALVHTESMATIKETASELS